MYLDLFDELHLNKRLIRIAGFEVAIYWAELQSILKQVVKKNTTDEEGFFTLDREYLEKETTLTVTKQLKCENQLIAAQALVKHPEDPNKIAINVARMVELLTDEDITKLKKTKTANKTISQKEAKIAGMKTTMKKALRETDPELRAAFERWVEGMIDAANCRFTKAVVQTFEDTINRYTDNKTIKLKLIEIATASSYRDANWAIEKLPHTHINTQKLCTEVSDSISF